MQVTHSHRLSLVNIRAAVTFAMSYSELNIDISQEDVIVISLDEFFTVEFLIKPSVELKGCLPYRFEPDMQLATAIFESLHEIWRRLSDAPDPILFAVLCQIFSAGAKVLHISLYFL